MQQHKPDLEAAWMKGATRYCRDEPLVIQFYQELVRHYGEPQRYYHNLDHIASLLQLFSQYEGELAKPDVVLFSIFYHDVIYTPGRSDNEHLSALLANRALEQLAAPASIWERVTAYIRATRDHRLSEDADPDLKLFIDFDLGILAADRETYREYVLYIRKEYGHLSAEHFAQGRHLFLQQMLHQEHIFYSDSFRAKEEVARKNMNWELRVSPGIYSAR